MVYSPSVRRVDRPFVRGRFEALPERPRRPHAYFETPSETLEMDSAPFGRIAVHLRILGSGPPLLLVHGLMTSSYSWRYVLPALAERFTVYAPDLPGAGRSGKPRERPHTAPAFARWIVELIEALGIRGERVVGNSLGGYLAMRAALLDPGAIGRLVNIHSPGVPMARLSALHAALSIPGAGRGLARWIRRAPERWAHANVHYYDESLKSLEEAREYGAPLADPEGVACFVRYLAECLDPAEMRAFLREAPRLAVPLMLIYSRQDPMVPPWVGERLHAALPAHEMVWLEDTSHFAHVDTPDEILAPMFRFLAGAIERA